MKLLIGENIKRLRRERDLTQEEVANHLGISFQSISKWERGDGYPDITLLPSLANYFDISVDELIGMDEIALSRKYDEINQNWEEKREAAREALEPIAWAVKHHLSALAETENDNSYLEKAEQICSILMSCE